MKTVIEQFDAMITNKAGEKEIAFPDQFRVFIASDDGKTKQQVGYCWKSTGNFGPIGKLTDSERECCLAAVKEFCGKIGNVAPDPIIVKPSTKKDSKIQHAKDI